MTHYKGNRREDVGGGAASDLKDKRGGAHDKATTRPAPSADDLPEGLQRERKGSYSPVRGRTGEMNVED